MEENLLRGSMVANLLAWASRHMSMLAQAGPTREGTGIRHKDVAFKQMRSLTTASICTIKTKLDTLKIVCKASIGSGSH